MNITKFILASVLISTSVLVAMTPANAETFSTESKGVVQFEKGSGLTNPVDPTIDEPVIIIPPEEEHNGTQGLLRFDQISNLNFGTMKISGSEQTAPASYVPLNQEKTEFAPVYLEVTDERGSNQGWKVSAVADEFKAVDKATGMAVPGADPLKGAKISFKNSSIRNHSNIPAEELSLVTPNAVTSFTLQADTTTDTATLITSAENQGMGIWPTSFFDQSSGATTPNKFVKTAENQEIPTDDSVTLSVPGTTKKSEAYKYVSQISWTLADTPE